MTNTKPSTTLIRRAALDLLARREHSFSELLRKLTHKNFPKEAIQPVLETLAKEGLLNEARFVENYLHARRNKGYGPLRIQAELKERGIAEDLIEHHVQITDNAWLSHAHRVWQKRFKNTQAKDYKMRVQQMRFLHYRGFTQEQIDSIFNSDSGSQV